MPRKHDAKGRSTHDTQHYRLHGWIARTAAWRALDGNEKAIYVDMALRYRGTNNGQIAYSVREGAACARVGKTKGAKCLRRLQELGFIAISEPAAFSWKKGVSVRWRLTEFRCDLTGNLPSKEFARWREDKPIAKENVQNAVRVQVHPVPTGGHFTPSAVAAKGRNGI